MAWNESGNGQDPWGRQRGNQSQNDLDKLIGNLQRKFKRSVSGEGGDGSGGILVVLGLAVAIWLATGFYRIDQAERGLELRFGEYTTQTGAGLHWHFPYPIETVEKVNVSVIETFEQEIPMLSADENFVVIDLAVQYRRRDPEAYQFNVRDPIDTVSDVSESAIREAVGKYPADFTLLGNRAVVAEQTKELIQTAFDAYEAGVEVTAVNLQRVDFPVEVQRAVQDAVKAREDKEKSKLEAQTYQNQIIPEARGFAKRQVENAEAYKARVINDAEGDTARFTSLLAEYRAAPEVTRERLYIDAIEYVYANSSKVFLDADGEGNLLYLPVDKLIENAGRSNRATQGSNIGRPTTPAGRSSSPQTDPSQETSRDRRSRR
ncbi:MAG: FtsH protease activity modulator HflK [Pseudomonadota bacterium]